MSEAIADDELWERFQASTLPVAAWTHRAHLRVGWMFLRWYPLDGAHVLMRVGIIRLNAFHGLVETPARGYHDTLTRVWLVLIASQMRALDAARSSDLLDACGDALGKDAPLRHYSRDRLFGVRARAAFVDPDREPLPEA